MFSGYTSRYSVYYRCACARNILCRTYVATTNSNSSSSSATAASFVFCCLIYAIFGSIDSSVMFLLDLYRIL